MAEQDFDGSLPAIWLAFGGSYMNHKNAPCVAVDNREQCLVDLLVFYLHRELTIPNAEQLFDRTTLAQLGAVCDLLKLWSQDLSMFYEIRKDKSKVKQMAQRLFQRIQTFEKHTIIPNGLLKAHHSHDIMKPFDGIHDHVNLAILTKNDASIDWVQVNPGSAYHQRYHDHDGEKSNACLEIANVDPNEITEDWLYLLVGLKAVSPPGEFYYVEVSLYECLLANLNGATVFKSEPNDNFMYSSHLSPIHTWQVVVNSFHYLLRVYLGVTCHAVYRKLLIGFKFFLAEKTLTAFQNEATINMQQCHFLLLQMCQDVAHHTLNQGTEEQRIFALALINKIKVAVEERCSKLELQSGRKCELDEPTVLSLSFLAPCLYALTYSANVTNSPSLNVEPFLRKPNNEEDIIGYLQQVKTSFVDKLADSKQFHEIVLLSQGIERFFIDYLAESNILKKLTSKPFSRDDEYLAKNFIDFGTIYFRCQVLLVNIVSNEIYHPWFYAKNVTIQFLVYAAVAALNYRSQRIGPILESRNLSVARSEVLSLHKIIPSLVIQDAKWLKVLLSVKDFFSPGIEKIELFSHQKFEGQKIEFEISNDANITDTDVKFAYQLLQTDETALKKFTWDHRLLDDEKLNRKWQTLAYTDKYLPSLYFLLSKVAYFAKISLTGLTTQNVNGGQIQWTFKNTEHWYNGYWWSTDAKCYWRSRVSLVDSRDAISVDCNMDRFTSYVLNPNTSKENTAYQRLIIQKGNSQKKLTSHLTENEIVATQDMKPQSMDHLKYLQLGFLQSEAPLKLERLYIALKDQHLDFGSTQESVLIKQTLFEISVLMEEDQRYCSLLEWTVLKNPILIHEFGLLCVEKARLVRHRLTKYNAIGEILEVILGILTFYPSAYKIDFINEVTDIFLYLKTALEEPSNHLTDEALMHLNAYLIISVQAKPQLLETEALAILKALLAIQNYKAKGLQLHNYLTLRTNEATNSVYPWIEHQLQKEPTLLNDLISSIIPQWDRGSLWEKNDCGLVFTKGDYTIKPLLGGIYFQNQPVRGLPTSITDNKDFKNYLGQVKFTVIPSTREVETRETSCFLSVGFTPQTRLTLLGDVLIIEEWIKDSFQRYIPVKELSRKIDYQYPNFIYTSPSNGGKLTHWLNDHRILIKDEQRNVVFRWNLKSNRIFSEQHQGYVVPWAQLEPSVFKIWLKNIEEPGWIEIIARPCQSPKDSVAEIDSLNFPRLGLHFEFREKRYYSRQVHGYALAKRQQINTMHGFSNYLVLINTEQDLDLQPLKVVIPHRVVRPDAKFYSKTVRVLTDAVLSSSYIVYDLDLKTNLLKSQNIRGQLYLALLYYCSGSLDDHDTSHCNAYHLARENLEACWKHKPFDSVELDIIEQFLCPSVMRDFHCLRVAVYLKVVSLLIVSVRLAFLFTDLSAQQSKARSEMLLKKIVKYIPYLHHIYALNKSAIFNRMKLSQEEEEDILKYYAYPSLPSKPVKTYKYFHKMLLSKDTFKATSFRNTFNEHLALFSLSFNPTAVNFTAGIDLILIERFRLNQFICLYQLAKSSIISVNKFDYLLLHLVIRAKVNYWIIPPDLVMMLARALLLVAENPADFPDSPSWFGVSKSDVELFNRTITKTDMLHVFPKFYWSSSKTYETQAEADEARRVAEQADTNENDLIWSAFEEHDLDHEGIPLRLPNNSKRLERVSLKFERSLRNYNYEKCKKLRDLYWNAAYNEEMYRFFVGILQKCDEQKCFSPLARTIAPFTDNLINVKVAAIKKPASTIEEPPNLEKLVIPSQPLVDLKKYFSFKPREALRTDFLFDSQLKEPDNGYQSRFYHELKDSWLAYHNEVEWTYSWLNPQSINELTTVLRSKYVETRTLMEQIWMVVSSKFKERPNGESDNYFALRWYEGTVTHYHKADLLGLLVEPNKLQSYNPNCLPERDDIIQKILQYVCCEINASKIGRVLVSIAQYKQSESVEEKLSLLRGLIICLQENINAASFRDPRWLLFQFENGIIVRENQRELIVAMLNQTEKAMYQLNMGEGKSSVILPLLSNNLADGSQLLRVNVLSALLTTMNEFLRKRFSGLLKKRIYSLPFYRDSDISTQNLTLILETLEVCQHNQHILLVTPEHRLCLQLKGRELLLENQQQKGATNIFNWNTYRQRVPKNNVHHHLSERDLKQLLTKQDERLRACLLKEGYIDSNNVIQKVPPRGQGRKQFAKFINAINDSTFQEWSCLKAAHRELLYNSTVAYEDSNEKLSLLKKISEIKALDLLDESDEILRHGTELNYTLGDKHVFSGGELRWQMPQFFIKAIFCDRKLRDILIAGKANGFTACNEHFSTQGGVPLIQMLNETFYDESIKPTLIDMFIQETMPAFRKYNSVECINRIRDYIAGDLSLGEEKKIVAYLANHSILKEKVLIAKGWLSHGILFHVFHAKYRVQYGLNLLVQDQIPKPIAIPFMGKDAPSPRSEFSHPDVMLGFTIISYLYQGLNEQQLKETLLKLGDKYSHQVADILLREWTEASRPWIEPQTEAFPPTMLTSLRHLDITDEQCLKQVHRYLSGSHLAILFYLNQCILPQEAKQYLSKISANAHSLVGYSPALGFSGTDDRKITMPFQIKSLRSSTQEGTNGKLLAVLTDERNSHYHSLEAEETHSLLNELCCYIANHPRCHALLDAGALVTGLSNFEVASILLAKLPPNFAGVLYFSDEGNSLTVLTRDNKTVSHQDCFLEKQFIFAYLDDVHTRGTDIRLPLNCHAILTVGMGMQKDKLMQAAMRLRQLAQNQSVSLWGTRIVTLDIARKNSVDAMSINSFEVIKWATRNTIDHINADLFPVAVRKIEFQFLEKSEKWLKIAPTMLKSLIQHCQSKETFSLEEFYGLSPQREDLADRLNFLAASRIRAFWLNIDEELRSQQLAGTDFHENILNRSVKKHFKERLETICKEVADYLQVGFVHSSLEDDEEKEVEVEIIEEQEIAVKIEKRDPYEEEPWDARLILQQAFISIAHQRNLIMPLKAIKHFVRLPADLKNIVWHPNIFMTNNYIQTVKSKTTDTLDNYLRPVDLLLMHRFSDETTIVLLSGKEASNIKSTCFTELSNNILVHIRDIDGPTQLPTRSNLSQEERKLLTVIKLFSGECNYTTSREVRRVAKRVGRLDPHFYISSKIPIGCDWSIKLYEILIQEAFLDFSGNLTEKLHKMLNGSKPEELLDALDLPSEFLRYRSHLLQKLTRIVSKLVVKPSKSSLQDMPCVLRQWVDTRGKSKEYSGSVLESILNPECQIKFPIHKQF